ncbi:hypothetical protein VNO77_44281 [Canavalia gladiata]|uniref:Uncharacterized protein n=1 Tax=Canavalia gladiata TaxID=3824 RepID=A0AAN9PQV4_CANGL
MSLASLSLLRHRAVASAAPLLLLLRRFNCFPVAAKRQNPKQAAASKNLLKGKQTLKQFSSLAPLLSLENNPPLSESQAIGVVAASQANFMRVMVPEEPSGNFHGVELLCVQSSEILDPPIANVDHLLVLFSLDQPKLEPFSLTRFMVEAESTGIPLTLALSKIELVDKEIVGSWKARLHSWGYEPIFCSVESGHGLDLLAFKLRDQTTVIVDPSGVGKSSLINALRNNPRASDAERENWFEPILGSKWLADQRVGEVSMRSGRGKHTTRHIRKMLNDNEPAKYSFNYCLHLGEPGSIVKGDWERYSFYFQLLDEIRIREELQLRTFGTKREGDVRMKMGDMGVQQAEPRLEPKKHRRQSRKRINTTTICLMRRMIPF